MTRRFVHPLALLFTFSILMFPLSRLQAADCGCPKPKVKITEISYADPEVVKVFFDDEEVKPTDDPVEMERDKEYKLTIKDVDPDAAHQCQPAELKFPHCTIEYSTDGGVCSRCGHLDGGSLGSER